MANNDYWPIINTNIMKKYRVTWLDGKGQIKELGIVDATTEANAIDVVIRAFIQNAKLNDTNNELLTIFKSLATATEIV